LRPQQHRRATVAQATDAIHPPNGVSLIVISPVKRHRRFAAYLWAAPCSAIGLALAGIALLAGGKAKWSSGALEVCLRPDLASCGVRAQGLRFRGIVFGHVILAVTREELAVIGAHERVHVAQYERWGALFFLAYGASSLWQLANGRGAYWNNAFEVEARELSMHAVGRNPNPLSTEQAPFGRPHVARQPTGVGFETDL
jgi:hypothetical protein